MIKLPRILLSALLILCLISGVYSVGVLLSSGIVSGFFGSSDKTILVMGTDKAGTRTDVMMLGFINGEDKRIDIVSIPRDTQVKIGSRYYKINSAYSIGKEEQAIETVEELLDVKIDGYVTFSVETFRDTIDALDGVDFDVPQDMFYEDPYQDLYIDLEEGFQHLDGEQAEGLVRYRKYPTADEGRIAVQQDFIKALIKQKATPATLFKLPELIAVWEENIDTNIDTKQAFELAGAALRIGVGGVTTHKLPGGAQTQYGASYYIYDKNETIDLISEITSD